MNRAMLSANGFSAFVKFVYLPITLKIYKSEIIQAFLRDLILHVANFSF